MSERVTIIDYGINNLLSICRAFEYCGATVKVAGKGEDTLDADRLVLPGVGAFPDGMKELDDRGLTAGIQEFYKKGKPLLGICLGMQLLMKTGFEIKETKGIGIIDGKVIRLPETPRVKIPHVNWNHVQEPEGRVWTKSILGETRNGDFMYFVHSFYTQLDNPDETLAQTMFGDFTFASALQKNNCWATQFHPEKSGEGGLKILKSFLRV